MTNNTSHSVLVGLIGQNSTKDIFYSNRKNIYKRIDRCIRKCQYCQSTVYAVIKTIYRVLHLRHKCSADKSSSMSQKRVYIQDILLEYLQGT